MIVVDASALAEVLLKHSAAPIQARLGEEAVHAPHLLDLEIAQLLRRLKRAGKVDNARAEEVFEDLSALPIERHAHDSLLWRIWQLRDRLTAYDASYLALAESLGCGLLTRDRGLAQVARATVSVEVL